MAIVKIPFVVEENYEGWRLDRYLQQKLGRASRTRIQKLIHSSLVSKDSRILKPSTKVIPGMLFFLIREEIPEPEGLPDRLELISDEDDILAINKPANLPVHPTARYYRGTVTNILGRDYRNEQGRRPDPAHRLDRETSGVLVCGRTKEMTRALKALFSSPALGGESLVNKEYIALVEGNPPWDSLIMSSPLAMLSEHKVRIRMSVVEKEHPSALPALTIAHVKKRFINSEGKSFTLISCSPKTGRQHQIRAHLHAEGYPLVGDKIYGHDETAFIRFTEGSLTGQDKSMLRMQRHALHAGIISFVKPFSKNRICLEAPIPPDMLDFINNLQLQD